MANAAAAGRDSGQRARLAGWLAAAALTLALAAGAGELLAGIGHRLQWWGYGAGIRMVVLSAGAALVALLLALAALIAARRTPSRRATALAALALLLSASAAAPPVILWRLASRLPPIHDISTDTQNPPQFVAIVPLRRGASNPLDYNEHVAAQQRAGYPDLAPARLDVPPARALELAERTARAMGWEIVAVSPSDGRIEATATTLLFAFKDDVVIRIRPSAQGSQVDLRSVSRVGRSDLGANAARIRSFLERLDASRRGA